MASRKINFFLCSFSPGTDDTEAWSFNRIQSDTALFGNMRLRIHEPENRLRNERFSSISNSRIKFSCTRLTFVAKVSYFNFPDVLRSEGGREGGTCCSLLWLCGALASESELVTNFV